MVDLGSLMPRSGKGRAQLAFASVALIAAIFLWIKVAGPEAHAGYDFNSYLVAARAIATGSNPYHRLITEYSSTHGQISDVAANGYVYPPLLATVLALPFRFGMTARELWLLWNIVNFLAVLWMGYECSRSLGLRGGWAGATGFMLLSLLPAVAIYDVSLGQADLLVTTLAVGAEAARLRAHWRGPIMLAAAIAIKPILILLLVVWLWRQDWRAAAWGAVCAVALMLIPFAFAGGMPALHDYWTFLSGWNAFKGSPDFINQSLYGVIARAVSENPYTMPLIKAPWLLSPVRYSLLAVATALWISSVNHWPLWKPSWLTSGWAGMRGLSCLRWLRFSLASMRQTPSEGRFASPKELAFCEYLLAFPLILLASPLSEDIHFCLLIPILVSYSLLTLSQWRWRSPAAWLICATYLLFCLPRIQELIYPTHLLILPGQQDSLVGPMITLLRTSALCLFAAIALVAGSTALKHARLHAGESTLDALSSRQSNVSATTFAPIPDRAPIR